MTNSFSQQYLTSQFPLKLIAIGALGTMLSPSALHLRNNTSVKYLRILDRGSAEPVKEKRRQHWKDYGAKLVPTLEELIDDGQFDGIIICAGKNGDDKEIFSQLIPLLKNISPNFSCFILHFSTVSCDFVQATYDYCKKHHILYANYPLTGGSKGAENAKMLILASGDKTLYDKVHPMLEKIGVPQYFNEDITYAASAKLIGHVLVFHGLLGISLATVLHKNISHLSSLEKCQTEFFDFLNNGAGGTKQWELVLRHGIAHNDWHTGFSINYAIIDILYTIQLLQTKKIPLFLTLPLLEVALLLIYTLEHSKDKNIATQTIAKFIAETPKDDIDKFLAKHLVLDIKQCLHNCIKLLPAGLKRLLLLDVVY